MKINVLGSKLVADASARSHKKIELDNRIVDLSLFSCLQDGICFPSECNYKFHSDNAYLNNLMELDLNKNVAHLINTDVTLVIDLMAARMEFYQFIFEDGSSYRLTKNHVSEAEFYNIKAYLDQYYQPVVDVKIVRPVNYSCDEIRNEIEDFCKALLSLINVQRIVLVKAHNTYQYFDTSGQFKVLSRSIDIVNRYNDFYDLCNSIFLQHINCITIDKPDNFWGEEKILSPNIFSYNRLYYEYINESLLVINTSGEHIEDTSNNDLLVRYSNRINYQLEKYKFKFFPGYTMKNQSKRKIILIGDAYAYEQILLENYGVFPDIKISYKETDTLESMENKLKEYSYQNESYMCMLPYIYKDTRVLEALWRNGFGNGIGYYPAIHAPIELLGFCGHYEDFWGNVVDSKSIVSIYINGISNHIRIDTNQFNANCRLTVLHNCNITIGEDVSAEDGGFSCRMYDEANLEIKKGAHIEAECHFRLSFFSNTIIGQDSVIGERSTVFNGDGHSIFYLSDGKNHNYDLNNSLASKHEIRIGRHVMVGKNVFILSGSRIHDDVYIEDGSFVNKEY